MLIYDFSKNKKIDFTLNSKVSRYKKLQKYLIPTAVYIGLPEPIEIPYKEDDQYFSITKKYENRLDLVAHKYYQNSKLWWVIALANNLEDAQHVSIGTVVRIPSMGSLFGDGGILE